MSKFKVTDKELRVVDSMIQKWGSLDGNRLITGLLSFIQRSFDCLLIATNQGQDEERREFFGKWVDLIALELILYSSALQLAKSRRIDFREALELLVNKEG